ncbi:hypothetical protein F4680DRAFT_440404 [Xylaria scruposa]|nr:hypothetical protein F4680DRAFT_440404 [Xylaria scruposa]
MVWPRKYLPANEARARVFFWDRQIVLTDFSSPENVRELGKLLLNYVLSTVYSNGVTPSSGSGKETQPLVFVSHSLGGLIAKAAIVEAMNSLQPVNIKGIVFLGTPHKGLNPQSLNAAVGELVRRAVNNRLGQSLLSSYLENGSRIKQGKDVGDYNELELEFIKMCRVQKIKVLTFAEEASQLVPSDCASYPPSFASNFHVNKHHEDLGRIDGIHDIVYREIVQFLLTVPTERRRSRSEIENLQMLERQRYAPNTPSPPECTIFLGCSDV